MIFAAAKQAALSLKDYVGLWQNNFAVLKSAG
jgi:hypothetical protein